MAETGLDRFSALREVVREGRKGGWGVRWEREEKATSNELRVTSY
jgi:hypothetical protein